MSAVQAGLKAPVERVIRGSEGWWFLGPGGIARLSTSQVSADGVPHPAVQQWLSEAGLRKEKPYRSYSLTVLTSTSCNLGCGYCFQNTGQDETGRSRPPRISAARLSSRTVGEILDFTAQRMERAGLDRLILMLFGGEPLLNPKGCRELLARAADYGLSWASMTSNATLLTPDLAEELAGLGLRAVQVTLDGDRPDHDVIRIRRSGGGTFDDIIGNLVAAGKAAPLRWDLRVNVSHHTADGMESLIPRLADTLDPKRCTLSFARVGDLGIGYGNELRHTEQEAARFARWNRMALDHGFEVPRPRAHHPCQACSFPDGEFGAVVSADGTLASCWETAGRPDWQVGTVTGGYDPRTTTSGKWVSCESLYRHSEEQQVLDTFADLVDAALLDYLRATDRLNGPSTAGVA